ncbi:Type III secretion system YscX (type_III_YscX) [Sulfidibacter corallicola]|uniref:Uncharacterized protein n=1 Tax=Sulfidibacter corallicola TaxID=2818388 RepID=A0A8A4TNH7_SULCO|nr:hypothetical protein [Sulfidibacter corallicola]QTD51113.1 hypothetical protein J3U87_01475 [Sulfidibacter corallicola]
MADPLKILSFDRGIEQIFQGDLKEDVRLPDRQRPLLPSESRVNQHLDKVIRTPNLELNLLESLQTKLQDKSILIPAVYRSLIGRSQKSLREAIKKAGPWTNKKALQEAAELLEAEEDLMDLLITYQNTLHKA